MLSGKLHMMLQTNYASRLATMLTLYFPSNMVYTVQVISFVTLSFTSKNPERCTLAFLYACAHRYSARY